MKIDFSIKPAGLSKPVRHFFELAAPKLHKLNKRWNPKDGAPVFTRKGKYTARGWTEWTQGFQFGLPLLQFDATGDEAFLRLGRDNTVRFMAPHVSHVGVHDHGFNTISTYGNLRRLAREGKTTDTADALRFYEMAIKASGAVQAARWTTLADGTGYIYSFNGPHSLFSDTIRSCRVLMLAHQLGHCLIGENDRKISLLGRVVEHLQNTSVFNVRYGEDRDIYDVRGRVVHESIFNINDGQYRCPSTQQGYSPFSTWTRGLAWVVLGFAEELECFRAVPDTELEIWGGRGAVQSVMLEAATAAADYYIEQTPTDGIPYWDTGAPGLARIANYLNRPSQPDNPHEPVDSSAAAIAAQGLLRLGNFLGAGRRGKKYWQAGLSVARTLFAPPYLAEDAKHEGLILHSVYHRPRGWDFIPPGKLVPFGESSMWGDYHAMELAVYLRRVIDSEPYLTFFDA